MSSISPYAAVAPVAATAIDPSVERELHKAHSDLLKHKDTCLFAGVILRGKNIIDYSGNTRTAKCDGKNKYYGYEFFKGLSMVFKRGVIMHENLHDAFLHMHRDKDLRDRNFKLYNIAADYVINGMIKQMPRDFIDLPPMCFHDEKYNGWSARQVFADLEQQQQEQEDGEPCEDGVPTPGGNGGNGIPQDSFDEHDYEPTDEMSPEEQKDDIGDVRDTLQQGALIAGMRSANIPREISEVLLPKVDWREELRDFVSEACRGRDDLTYRRYNRRSLADDDYRPSYESETLGEIVFPVDVSGSISNDDLAQVAGELSALCTEMQPSAVRVLWWDTEVKGEQVFLPEHFDAIATLLKPCGGGGTDPNCIPKYLEANGIKPEAIVVMTDGEFYTDVNWTVSAPTLWVLAGQYAKKDFVPPSGRVIQVEA